MKQTSKMPTAPAWLDAEAKKKYGQTIKDMEEIGIAANQLDAPMIAIFCQSYADVIRLTQAIRSEGDTVQGYRGSDVKNPKCNILTAAHDRMVKAADKLGFSPNARKRIGDVMPRQEGENGVSKFMRKGGR